MKTIYALLSLFLLTCHLYSQNQKEVLQEGKILYFSEKASWNGTDLFIEKFPEKRNLIGGYFSYSDNNNYRCIFFSKDSVPIVMATFDFDSTFKNENSIINTDYRKFTEFENDLYTIRKKALYEMNTDTLFKTYKNTNLNPIPIISAKERKVYVLTGPEVTGIVIFGNDYLLTFDDRNNLISKKSLHNNIITIEYNEDDKDVSSFHGHKDPTGDIITATDICTLMLYEKYAHWKTHYVISKNYVSIWDCATDYLLVMTREAWDKIK